jgi:Domain of unknown function (DUF4189)
VKQVNCFCRSALITLTMIFNLYPKPGLAEGAIALAQPPNIVKQGFAFGTSWNYTTVEEARSEALARCRRTDDATRRALCKVIRTFHNECVAVAMDPKNGTPGAGWAVEAAADKAEAAALAECRATAGERRKQFCQISGPVGCDTKSTSQ